MKVKYRHIDWTVTAFTFILIALTILTFIVDQHKSNWGTGPALLLFELLAIGLQTILTFVTWLTKSKIVKIIMIVVSVAILTFFIYGFIQFDLHCT